MAQEYNMEIGSFLRFSMENAKRHWLKFFGVILGGVFALGLILVLIMLIFTPIHPGFAYTVTFLSFIVCAIGLSFGFLINVIRLSSNRSFDISSFIPRAGIFFNFLFGMLCYMLIVSIGTMLFIVPGIVLGLMFSLVPFLIVDRKMNFIEAFGESARLTKGHKMDIFIGSFITNIVIGLISIFIITLFFTIPMSAFLSIYPYVQLSGLADAPVDPTDDSAPAGNKLDEDKPATA